MLSASAETITLFDGNDVNNGAPIYGYNYDSDDYITQTILPETDLTALQGKYITGMKFYVSNDGGNNLSGGQLAVSIGMTPQAAFPSWSPTAIGDLTHVADITMTAGETEIVVEFEEPFYYINENLVIETKVVESSGWAELYFFGENALVNNVLHQRYATSTDAFYPKTTFTYTDGEGPVVTGRGDVNGDGMVSITDVTIMIDYMLGNEPTVFIEENADTYPDGIINIADVTTLIDYLLYHTWD